MQCPIAMNMLMNQLFVCLRAAQCELCWGSSVRRISTIHHRSLLLEHAVREHSDHLIPGEMDGGNMFIEMDFGDSSWVFDRNELVFGFDDVPQRFGRHIRNDRVPQIHSEIE